MRRNAMLFVLGLFFVACSGGQVPLPRATDIKIAGTLTSPERPRNVVYRDELTAAVADGLPYFLQRVSLSTITSRDESGQEQFVGRRIDAMRPASAWLAFDLAPGDVVTHINGVSLGHYNAVIPMFEGLPQADHIDVQLLRGDEQVTVRVRVESRPTTAQ